MVVLEHDMKVNGNNPPDLQASKAPVSSTPKGQADAAKVATAAVSNPGVSVLINSSARAMGKEQVGQASDVDSKKVAVVKAAIANGSFTVNPEAIADKLLANASEMFKVTPK